MEEVLVGAIGEADPEFAMVLEIIEDEGPVQGSAVAGGAGGGLVLEDSLGVPAVEAPGGVGAASARHAPVVPGFQIGVAAKVLGDDEVDVIVDVEDGLDLGPGAARIGDDRFHGVEGTGLLRGGSARIQPEHFVVLVPVVGCVVVVFEALVEVEDAPVDAVDVEVHEVALPAVGIAHVDHAVTRPLVADHGGTGALGAAAVDPRVVVHGPQVDAVESRDGGPIKDGVVEFPGPVEVAEAQAEGVLDGFARRAAGAALQLASAVDLEPGLDVDAIGHGVGMEVFSGDGSFDVAVLGVEVDSVRTKEVVLLARDRESGNVA